MNKKVKLITSICLSLLLAISLVGCGSSGGGSSAASAPKEEAAAAVSSAVSAAKEAVSEAAEAVSEAAEAVSEAAEAAAPAGDENVITETVEVDYSLVAKDPDLKVLEGAENYKIGVLMRTQDNPYFYALGEKINQYLTAVGFQTTGIMTANEDVDVEYGLVEQMIAQGCNIIVCDGVQPASSIGAASLAIENGVTFIAVDDDLLDAPDFNICSNNPLNGYQAGYYLANNYLKDEPIYDIHIGGYAGEREGAGADRGRGLMTGIVAARLGIPYEEAFPIGSGMYDDLLDKGTADCEEADFHVLGIGYGEWEESKGLTAAEDLIVANKDKVNCMTGENEIMLLGAYTAVENNGLQDKIYMAAGSDAYSVAIKQMMDNEHFNLVAVGINSPYMIAAATCDACVQILLEGKDKDSFPQHIWGSQGIVTKEVAEQVYNPDSIF